VEWSGSNWNVQRIEHTFTDAQVTPTQTESISSVGDISRAFFHTQQRIGPTSFLRDVCLSGTEVELTADDTLTYRILYNNDDVGWTSFVNINATTWIVSNTETNSDRKMIVNHYNPSEHPSGGAEEDNWQVTINALSYGISEAAITGFSTQTDNCDQAYPHSFLNANLTSTTTVDFWQSDSDEENQYTFQVTEFPRTPALLVNCSFTGDLDDKKWTIGNIKNDYMDPEILNNGETVRICSNLSNPLYPNGDVEIIISTDHGFSITKTLTGI